MKRLTIALSVVLFVYTPNGIDAKTDWEKTLAKGYQELSVGNTENAIVLFSNKVKNHPDSAACRTALGRAYKRKGRIDEAKSEFKQATQLEPTYADGFYELGVLQESDRNWADAANAFERYLVLKPDASERRALEDRIAFCKGHAEGK
jgi:Flp pilus assembly protein TadD